jgi:hypothetical protein
MAAPNLTTLTTITGKSTTYSCTATLSAALQNPGSSGKVFKLNSIRAANIDTLAYTLDVTLYDGTSHAYICKNLEIGQASSVVLLTKDECLYIEEGESIYAKASFANEIDLIFSYEELS